MNAFAMNLGYVCLTVGGMLLAAAFFALASFVMAYYGRKAFKDVRRVYHLRVIGYWLDRLEREGKRCFEKAD